MVAVTRRDFCKWGGIAALAACAGPPHGKADYTLRIATGTVELAPGRVVSTLTYNGQFPGPLLRFMQGRRTWVDVYNDTDAPEQLHWHGQHIGADVDGAAEEGTPYVPRTACAGFRSFPARPASASITPMWCRAPICPAASTADWSGRCTSRPRTMTPVPSTTKSS